jgi:membrane-anchored protein YejM (alkaline phosphatase superfamily)
LSENVLGYISDHVFKIIWSHCYASPRSGSAYGDAVRELDAAVGDLLSAVVRLGLDKTTMVVFTSDNGAALVSREQG